MPIIINEIEIAVEVVPSSDTQNGTSANLDIWQREEIIKECVEKVIEILNQKTER